MTLNYLHEFDEAQIFLFQNLSNEPEKQIRV